MGKYGKQGFEVDYPDAIIIKPWSDGWNESNWNLLY